MYFIFIGFWAVVGRSMMPPSTNVNPAAAIALPISRAVAGTNGSSPERIEEETST
jgi:hypothetical protein